MKSRFIAIIYSILLLLPLTACTDVRERVSPDVLAVDLKKNGAASFAVQVSQAPEETVRAEGDSPLLVCTALRAAAGKEIDAGHISLLLLRGDPAALLPDYLAMQALMPTSAVLLCRGNPCTLSADYPDTAQLRAAVDAGLLPARTADLILGDLQNGSGVSALPIYTGDRLTLALCGTADGAFPTLSADACRGLALLGGRCKKFSFRAGDSAVTVQRTKLRITAAEDADGVLSFTLRGSVTCKPEGIPAESWLTDAETVLHRMLTAACTEPLLLGGADLLLLRETAVRDGVSGAADCTNAAWRDRLTAAEFAVETAAESASRADIG